MPRGVTEQDVWQAADALLLEGERPTIERVRQKIGRGSPNTVSPLLDTWFKHLGGRIKDPGAFAAPPDVPEVVLQAAKHFWEAALAESRRDFDQRLRDGLAAAVANVEAEKERAAIADAAAFEASAKVARLQADVEQLQAHLSSEKLGRATAEAELTNSRRKAEELQARLSSAAEEVAKVQEEARQSLEEALERFAATERRASREIDAARVAKDKAERRASALEQRLESAADAARRAQAEHASSSLSLQSELVKLRTENEQLKSQGAALQRRTTELESALTEANQRAQSAVAGEELADRLVKAMRESQADMRKPSSKRRASTST